MQLDEGEIRIVEASDGRGDGVAGLQFDVLDVDALNAAVTQLGLSWQGNSVEVCGTRFIFRDVSGADG